MMEKLSFIENKYDELSHQIADPAIMGNQSEWQKLVREHSDLEDIVTKYREYKTREQQLEENKAMLSENGLDSEMKEMFQEDNKILEAEMEEIRDAIQVMLIPKDPNDKRNVFVEIRGGAGGDEAALFAHSLYRLYVKYAEARNWKVELMSVNETDIGGFKEVVFMIKGDGAYSRLKYESGVHRVQRVPETESSGRIHTSTATVAIMPEVDDVDVQIDPNDLRIDVYRSSGNGGQSVNTTDSAVRITHIPSGIVVAMQDEKSQLKNKEKGMKVLQARLYEQAEQERNQGIADERRSQVGTGDRSERIRTYNYPQGRVTDHRIGMTLYKLEAFMDGDIDEMLDALAAYDQSEKLKLMGRDGN